MQTRKGSMAEVAVNILIGYWISFALNMLVFLLYNIEVSLRQNFEMGLIFTVASIIRSYYLRRFFNWLHGKGYFVAK